MRGRELALPAGKASVPAKPVGSAVSLLPQVILNAAIQVALPEFEFEPITA